MTALAEALMHEVLRRFEHDLHEATDPAQFDELACYAEGCYCTDLGARMRDIVDHERALHGFGLNARAVAGRRRTLMHTLLTGWERCDHINGDGLDNRRANLRQATRSQNMANRRKSVAGTASRFKGVSLHADRRQWRAQIGVEGKKVYLGLFPTEELAARAYDEQARVAFGEFAALNFPRPGEASCLR